MASKRTNQENRDFVLREGFLFVEAFLRVDCWLDVLRFGMSKGVWGELTLAKSQRL